MNEARSRVPKHACMAFVPYNMGLTIPLLGDAPPSAEEVALPCALLAVLAFGEPIVAGLLSGPGFEGLGVALSACPLGPSPLVSGVAAEGAEADM